MSEDIRKEALEAFYNRAYTKGYNDGVKSCAKGLIMTFQDDVTIVQKDLFIFWK